MGIEVIIPEARAAFIDNLFVPGRYDDDPKNDLRWSLTWLIAADSATKKLIDDAVKKVAVEAFKDRAEVVLEQIRVNQQKLCWQDGKFKADKYDGYAGSWALATNRKVDKGPAIWMDNDRSPIINDRYEFYPGKAGRIFAGCYIRGKVEIYAYSKPSPGIAASFSVVQRLRSGDSFGGGKPPTAEEFGEVADGADADDLA